MSVLEKQQRRSSNIRRRQRSVTISDVERSASPTRPSTPVCDRELTTHSTYATSSMSGKARSIEDSVWKEHGYHRHGHGYEIRTRSASETSLTSVASIDSLPDVDLVSLVERSIALRSPRQRAAPHFSTSPVLRPVDAGAGAYTGTSPKIEVQTPSLKSSTSSVQGGVAAGKLKPSTSPLQSSPPRRPSSPHMYARPSAIHQRSSSALPRALERPILPHRSASDALTQASSRSLPSSSESATLTSPTGTGHLEPSVKLGSRRRSKASPTASPAVSSPLSLHSEDDEPAPSSFDLNDGGVLTPCTCRANYFGDKYGPPIYTCSASRQSRSFPGLGSGTSPSGLGVTLRSASASSSPPISTGYGASSTSSLAVRPVPIPTTATTCMSSDEGGPVLMPKPAGSLQSAWSAERASRKLKQQEGRVCFDEVLGIQEDKRDTGRRWNLWWNQGFPVPHH